eukprot:TRINITY_DN5618_c1_g1_i1.p1 TRINITY_DN5618_c1_g1~~TRINITY_DN5618_c1_g1_i1.p1  ORF type:complete len:498 (-),score=89.57 TRINITY_DN5618_c1_g1_i1:1369-2862(-)
MGCCHSDPSSAIKDDGAVAQKVSSEKKYLGEVLNKYTPDVSSQYSLGKVLGRGQFGVTKLATRKQDNKKFACKTISKRKLMSEADMEDVRREVQIMHHLKGHPNIVTLVDSFEDKHDVHLIMELCSGGELFDRIVSQGHYSEKSAAEMIRTIISAVAHCHDMNVFHRDLKPENFLLSDESSNAVLKATDFGLSVFFKEDQKFHDVVGSAYYVAPEVLRRNYGYEADLWSCGVMLYILLSGVPPFWGESEHQVFREILSGDLDLSTEVWKQISSEAKDCVKRLLERNPAKRALAAEILQHDWLKENGVALDKPLDITVVSRIKGFAAMNKLKKEALRVIALNLPAEEIAGLKAMFQSIDTDKSGTITVSEMKEALKLKGGDIPSEELQRIMENADVDGDGVIEYEEFLASTLHINKIESKEQLYKAFQHFDTDNDGCISRSELEVALKQHFGDIQENELETIIEEVDKNHNGTIDYDEFVAMMRKTSAAPKSKTSIRY